MTAGPRESEPWGAPGLGGLPRRRLLPELMDDPALEPGRHARALRALGTVNLLSGTAARIWREVRALPRPAGRALRVLDLACGGGDVAVALALRGARERIPVEVHGCDRSPFAVEHARASAEERGAPARFFELDVLEGPLPGGYDLMVSSLFLHHLTDADAVRFLRLAAGAAPALFLQDLRRTRLGWLLAVVTLHTVARSDVAQVDGVRSVAGAFTLDEVRALAREAGLEGARLTRCWPQRFALAWRREGVGRA